MVRESISYHFSSLTFAKICLLSKVVVYIGGCFSSCWKTKHLVFSSGMLQKCQFEARFGGVAQLFGWFFDFLSTYQFSVHECGTLHFYFPVPRLLLCMFLTSVAFIHLRLSSPLAVLIHLSCFAHLFFSKYYAFFPPFTFDLFFIIILS